MPRRAVARANAGSREAPGRLHRLQAVRRVCPMGIDIRDGPQLECINCALCIDACNSMMAKTGGLQDPDLLQLIERL